MAKKEAQTDMWVSKLLDDAEINYDYQGSNIKEIDEALKTASKKKTNKHGYPEFVAKVEDYLLVIEDKASLDKHIKEIDGVISAESKDVQDYAVNGAVHYANHIAKNTNYKKILAIGISGDEKHHTITPVYVDQFSENYKMLDELDSFICVNKDNIENYYVSEILNEDTDQEKELKEILKDAADLHEDLRTYGNIKDQDKPLVVSGILLALAECDSKNFSIDSLNGDKHKTDGQKIFEAIETHLKTANVAPETKRDKVLSQFAIIKDTEKINSFNSTLCKTPLKHYTEFLYDRIYKHIRYSNSAEDYLGRFYGEFMSYSGGDGQTLGIVLTPKHITQLFCELLDLKSDDVVLDPCCGTGGFLVAAMHHMINSIVETKGYKKKKEIDADPEIRHIRQEQLFGIELQPNMFTIAVTNMILRKDGKSNLQNDDFLALEPNKLRIKHATVGMMNPPYSQGSKNNPNQYEIAFVEHLLDSLADGGRCAVIVPQSAMTGKTKDEQAIKDSILKNHTLEGVITLNTNTFYNVGTNPCIAIFTTYQKHNVNHKVKFINFEDDGYKVAPHIGLLETETAKDKRQHLLDVWKNKIDAETKFCVETTIESTDEWLHSYYYFNDEIPTEEAFEKAVGDYLSFEFSMIMQGKSYLLEED